MIGRARHPGAPGARPVLAEPVVDPVAALGGLDEGEGDAARPRLRPVDARLVLRHVDAVDVVVPRGAASPVVRVVVLETRGADRHHAVGGDLRRRRRTRLRCNVVVDRRTGAEGRKEHQGCETPHRRSFETGRGSGAPRRIPTPLRQQTIVPMPLRRIAVRHVSVIGDQGLFSVDRVEKVVEIWQDNSGICGAGTKAERDGEGRDAFDFRTLEVASRSRGRRPRRRGGLALRGAAGADSRRRRLFCEDRLLQRLRRRARCRAGARTRRAGAGTSDPEVHQRRRRCRPQNGDGGLARRVRPLDGGRP